MEQIKENLDKNYEIIKCCICNISPKLWASDYHGNYLSKCPSCGLRFVTPRLKSEVLAEKVYTPTYYHNERFDPKNIKISEATLFPIKVLKKYKSFGSLFDVSAGNGTFLLAAKQNGYNISGSEIHKNQSELLAKLLGCKIYTGYIETLEIKEKYDIVTFIHVLEHTSNPVIFLKKCISMLEKGGILYGLFPNTKSLSDRFKTFLSDYGLKNKKYKHLSADHHLWFFDLKTTKKLFKQIEGIEVLSLRTMVNPAKHNLFSSILEKTGLATWIEVVAKKN
jgi:2-polyprenyl-3-methyl-5-hydroxy-6-metoxy-1,4-benzoquinol methylase